MRKQEIVSKLRAGEIRIAEYADQDGGSKSLNISVTHGSMIAITIRNADGCILEEFALDEREANMACRIIEVAIDLI